MFTSWNLEHKKVQLLQTLQRPWFMKNSTELNLLIRIKTLVKRINRTFEPLNVNLIYGTLLSVSSFTVLQEGNQPNYNYTKSKTNFSVVN